MLLSEMSLDYKRDQLAFHSRIKELRAAAKAETDPRRAAALEARARDLEPLRREARELADLTGAPATLPAPRRKPSAGRQARKCGSI